MKGKKSLILASIFAAVGLVGATFAAWAVTDNADPFGLKISPGTISQETNVDYVTLSYGEKYNANISNIASGKTYLAASAQLLASTSTKGTYTGKLNVALINQTEKGSGEKLLINYLTVDVYSVENEQSPIAKAQGSELVASDLTGVTKKNASAITSSADVEIICAHNTAKQVYVTVTLQEGLDASTLQSIHDDVVYIQVNWNSRGETDEVKATKIYFKYGTTAGKDVYCFAWNSSSVNKNYPGVLMTDEAGGLYSYNLNVEYGDVLFVVKDHEGTEEIAKTGDLSLTTGQRQTTPCFIYNVDTPTTKGNWGVVPEDLAEGWYAVGTFNSWTPSTSYKLSTGTGAGEFVIEGVQLEAGAKVKVRDASGANWKGAHHTYDDCGYDSVDGDGNAVVNTAGVYTIHFWSNSEDGNYISLSK